MRRLITLYGSSVGKKIAMAATGAIMFLFVIGHLAGNLKLYAGEESFNKYAHWLREIGYPALGHNQFLWIFRFVLLVCVAVHIISAIQLALQSWRAREICYRKQESIAFSYASYTMRWGGLLVALYVIYHLFHLTWGSAHHNFDSTNPYQNVVDGFKVWWVSLIYMIAIIVLGLHLYHGLWSAMQTMGFNNPKYNAWRRPTASIIALVIAIGYISIPVSVLFGIVK